MSPKDLLDSIEEKRGETELQYNQSFRKEKDREKEFQDNKTEENNGKQERENGKEEKAHKIEENDLGKEKKPYEEERLPNGYSRATLFSFIPQQEPSLMVYHVTREPHKEPCRGIS